MKTDPKPLITIHLRRFGPENNGTPPIFLAGTRITVAVTSWGIDPNCAGPGFGYRTDIAESLDFISQFLP